VGPRRAEPHPGILQFPPKDFRRNPAFVLGAAFWETFRAKNPVASRGWSGTSSNYDAVCSKWVRPTSPHDLKGNQMDMPGRGDNRDLPRNQEPDSPPPPPPGPDVSPPNQVPQTSPPASPAQSAQSEAKEARPATVRLVYFHYLGQTGMTVVGPVTGNLYNFGRTGAVVAVDSRDAETLARISRLRLINVRPSRSSNG
jgi:hypothetical protein